MTVFKADELLQRPPYQYEAAEKKPGGAYYAALAEELCFHYDHNEKYRRFCQEKGFDPHGFAGDLAAIPPVQVSVFKAMGRELRSVPADEIKLTLQSSATSGVPSSVPVDRLTAKRQAKAMVRTVGDFIGNCRRPFLIMDIDPALGFREKLGARFAAVSGYLKFASQTGFFLRVDEAGKYYFDVEGIERYIAGLDPDTPAVVFGFTYILYAEVVRPLLRQGVRFTLPRGSQIIHIGGWKKLESEKISKEEFARQASALFGVEPEAVIDIYGFTEQMGLNYPTCPCGCKHAPLYAEVLVRDPVTKQLLPDGQEGLLEFVTPLPHSYPGNAVLTDDVGVIAAGDCPYGRSGKRFQVTGRLKKAEIRGCGDILSSKLVFAHSGAAPAQKAGTVFRVEYFSDPDALEGKTDIGALDTVIDALTGQLSWLRRQPVDALIGLVSQAARKWTVGDGQAAQLQASGQAFLANWCSAGHLTKLLDAGLQGSRMHMDAFLPADDEAIQYRRAVSRGLCCHWLAGNVQVLGMFVLIESMLTKNVNLLKVSSRDGGVFCRLLRAFEGEVYETPGGYRICGDDLLRTVAVVYYDRENRESSELMSRRADIRVAWGGAEAVDAVAHYAKKYDCEDLIMGPKLSFSAVAAEALDGEHSARKLGRRIAVDASVFDQTGCASAHNVFVERGGAVSPQAFAEYLAAGMQRTTLTLPKAPDTPEQAAAIHAVRSIFDFKGIVYGDENAVWTVLYDPDVELCAPVYSRVVFVHPVDSILDAVRFVDENIQTVGLAARGEKALRFAAMAAERGAVRFPVCGRMLNFDSPWDGMYLTDRMVRWVTLGGPRT